jgi:hypothetical protein
VCMSNPRSVLVLPCKHVVLCEGCTSRLRDRARKASPWGLQQQRATRSALCVGTRFLTSFVASSWLEVCWCKVVVQERQSALFSPVWRVVFNTALLAAGSCKGVIVVHKLCDASSDSVTASCAGYSLQARLAFEMPVPSSSSNYQIKPYHQRQYHMRTLHLSHF